LARGATGGGAAAGAVASCSACSATVFAFALDSVHAASADDATGTITAVSAVFLRNSRRDESGAVVLAIFRVTLISTDIRARLRFESVCLVVTAT
jgi:hypothetical protein